MTVRFYINCIANDKHIVDSALWTHTFANTNFIEDRLCVGLGGFAQILADNIPFLAYQRIRAI